MENSSSDSFAVHKYEDIQNRSEEAIFCNVTHLTAASSPGSVGSIFVAFFLGVLILLTLIGNFLVIAAILTEKSLKGIENYLILSLAVADLMVAFIIMPLSAYNEVNKQWTLGTELCQMWTSLDVLFCTASILHLLAIAVDRYWVVTNVEYARSRDPKKIYLMIGSVWTGAVIISIAPILGWKEAEFYELLEKEKQCSFSQNVIYLVFATCASFFIPLVFILVLYWNIFKQIKKRIQSKSKIPAVRLELKSKNGFSTSHEEGSTDGPSSESSELSNQGGAVKLRVLEKRKKKIDKESTEAKREKKVAKTLMIITGAFVFCWLPFFVTVFLMAVCEACMPSDLIFNIILWLGYANSLINPIIYTLFSPDFKNAFKRMLCKSRTSTLRVNI